MELKVWILSSVVVVLISGVTYTSKLIVKYIKSELENVIEMSNKHAIALAENTEQLKSLFQAINKLISDNANIEKRINHLEVETGKIKQSCSIYHKTK